MAEGAPTTSEAILPPDAVAGAGLGRPGTSRRYVQLALWIALTDVLAVEAAILLTRFARYGLGRPGPSFVGILILASAGLYTFYREQQLRRRRLQKRS